MEVSLVCLVSGDLCEDDDRSDDSTVVWLEVYFLPLPHLEFCLADMPLGEQWTVKIVPLCLGCYLNVQTLLY